MANKTVNSDIIKIGFDYRSSLAQFEKETGGVFDDITEKAGKQKIVIQLDAKDDKVIEKIRELQKLKLDDFTFEFGSSGAKEQLKTFSQLENKIIEIISLSKQLNKISGKTDFNTKNKTEAYNQLKEIADVYKKFYNNKETMHSKAGTDAAYAYYKAYEEALKKGVSPGRLEKVTVDVDYNNTLFTANKISSDRIMQSNNFQKYGEELTDLSIEISNLENRLLKFDNAYSKVATNLGSAPITSEILKNIEEYVRNLEIAEARAKEVDLFTKEDVDIYKDSANMYLGFAVEDAIKENEEYISSLKDVEAEKEKADTAISQTPAAASINELISECDKLQQKYDELNGQYKELSTNAERTAITDTSTNLTDNEDFQKLTNDVEKLKTELKDLSNSFESLKSGTAAIGGFQKLSETVDSLTNKVKGLDSAIKTLNTDTINSNSDETRNTTKASITKSIQTEINNFNSKLKNLSARKNQSDIYIAQIEKLSDAIKKLKTEGDRLSSLDIINENELKHFKDLEKEVNDCINAFKHMSAAEKGSTENSRMKMFDKIGEYLKNNTNLSKGLRQELKLLQYQLENGGDSVNVNNINEQFLKVKNRIRNAKQEGKRFLDIIKDKAWYGWAAQLAGMFGFYDIINGFKNCIITVRDFDTALTEMRKVSDESVQSLKNFQKESFSTADSIGSTAVDLQDATADWMRLGETLEEAKQSARDATILLNVSEFDNIDAATESLVAMSQAYQELDKMEIIDVLDNIGNNYSIATDELSTALQDSAAVLKTQGNDLNKAVALITAGNAITQDASKTAGGVRTISLRLAGTEEAKEELASLGEDVSDFIVQTKSKTQQLIKDYTAVASNAYQGVDVLDANGNLRSTYDILLDIAKVYKEIQETDKIAGTNRAQALIEAIAGKNRSNIASSILLNSELLEDVYESAKNSEGAAMKELDAYMESIDAKVAQFKNQLQELEYNLVDSDLVKWFVDFGKDSISVLDTLIEKLDLFPVAITAIYTAISAKNGGGLIRLVYLINNSPFLATVEFNSDVYDSCTYV